MRCVNCARLLEGGVDRCESCGTFDPAGYRCSVGGCGHGAIAGDREAGGLLCRFHALSWADRSAAPRTVKGRALATGGGFVCDSTGAAPVVHCFTAGYWRRPGAVDWLEHGARVFYELGRDALWGGDIVAARLEDWKRHTREVV